MSTLAIKGQAREHAMPTESYPAYPENRTAESAYYLLDGPTGQRRMNLELLIADCEIHADGAPEGWGGSLCQALKAEAEEYLAEIE